MKAIVSFVVLAIFLFISISGMVCLLFGIEPKVMFLSEGSPLFLGIIFGACCYMSYCVITARDEEKETK